MAHKLLQAIKSSKPSFGIWQTIPGTFHCRTIGQTAANGLDWVCLDCEHGLIALQGGTAECITALTTATKDPPSVLVRVPATGASTGTGWQIKVSWSVERVESSTKFQPDRTRCWCTWRYRPNGELPPAFSQMTLIQNAR